MALFSGISANVVILGLVSFLTDVSSEMIYPLLPLFVATLPGGSAAFLGLIEGAAETTAALLKLVSGSYSDRVRSRKGLVLAGYGVSALARPLIALAVSPLGVLLVRVSDRVGKGVRTSPRDALIADSSPPDGRGKAFGFHRSMDHAGAVVGPLLATIALYVWAGDLRTVFWLAGIPGLMAVALIVLKLRDVPRAVVPLSAARRLLPGPLPRRAQGSERARPRNVHVPALRVRAFRALRGIRIIFFLSSHFSHLLSCLRTPSRQARCPI